MKDPRKKFSKIYDQYIEKIYRFVFLKVGSKETAEDLTSETFSRGWKAFKKSQREQQDDIKNIEAFLYRIAKNLIADFYRRGQQPTTVSIEKVELGIVDPKPNPGQEALKKSDVNQVRTALASLKQEYQDVIIWRHVEQMSTKEVAQKMDKSEEAVRVQLHRAMKSLKVTMNKEQ